MNQTAEKVVGIDLGTTNSLVAYCDERGPRILEVDGEAILPSVVCFDAEGRPDSIGKAARSHAVERPLNTVFSVKRLMGRGLDDLESEILRLPFRIVRRSGGEARDIAGVQIGERVFSPPEISAMILSKLREAACRQLQAEVGKAVITVPAYFDDAQRQATRDAGQIAGWDVLRLVNEPTAAALAYGLDRKQKGTIAVFDLGGGTFDISILQLHEGVFEVLSTHGDTHLGGDDFDDRIVQTAIAEIEEQFGLNVESPRTRQALRTLAESVKMALSGRPAQSLEIELGRGETYRRTFSADEFESMIEPLIDRTIDSCQHALRAAKLRPEAIDEVVMVGGSTRIPYVRRRVAEFFGRRPYTALHPEHVVALGASVQAAMLAGTRRDALLLDVTPLSLGIETMGGAMGKLISANVRVPCRETETFTTFQDGQTAVKINVLQGERELVADCRSLGVFELRGIPPMPAGIPKVEVTFLIDHNGILNVTAQERRSGVEASIQVIPSHGLTREEVKQMQNDAVRFAREDMSAHRRIDLLNQIEFDTGKAEEMLNKFGHLLAPDERHALDAAIKELRSLSTTDAENDVLQRRLQSFGQSTARLAELGIAEALKSGPKT